MNVPVVPLVDAVLEKMGTDSTLLGNGSIGLIKAPFSSSDSLTMGAITEADFDGYKRLGYGNPSIAFTGADGNEYVQGTPCMFQPTGSSSPNTCYGLFITNGHDTTVLQDSDAFDEPIPMASPANSITVIPRFGLNPDNGLGLNVISD